MALSNRLFTPTNGNICLVQLVTGLAHWLDLGVCV